MNSWVRTFATSMLLASLIASPVQAASTKASPEAVALATACTDLNSRSAGRRGCAEQLQKSLMADPDSVMALQRAAERDDQSSLKDVLMKMGLSEAELADASIVVDQGKGASRNRGVTVTISCCPLKIVITIRL